MGNIRKRLVGLAAASTLAATTATGAALAQSASEDKVKVGVMLTLSGPAAVLGEQARDGFQLAVDDLNGQLGGVPAEIIVVDDEQKPDLAADRARELVDRQDVDFVVGPIFSNVLQAIARPVVDSDTFLISPNAGTSNFAGAECHPNLFVASYQNDQVHEVLGAYAAREKFGKVFLMAPNYQAGRDSLAGFKRSYDGEVVGEVYTTLGQLDFSAELAQIATFQPDAVFAFMPGGMGVNLVRQYRQNGLASIPFLSAFTVDESTLPAQGADALGFFGGANWAPNIDLPNSQQFVEKYIARFDRVPGTYAAQGYDTAMMIDAAIRAVGGDLSDRDGIRTALRAADFESLRGDFALGPNHFPIQDFYLVKAAERPDGKFQTEIVETIFEDYADNYASQCEMK